MAEFKVIESQEQLDAIIKDRLERERKHVAEQYADYDSIKGQLTEAQEKLAGYEGKTVIDASELETLKNDLADRNKTIEGYKLAQLKSTIADEVGLDRKLISRLNGDSEDAIREDATALKSLFDSNSRQPLPLAAGKTPASNPKDEAWANFSANFGTND